MNSGLVSFTPSRPKTTSSSPPHAPSRPGLMVGIDVRSGLSGSSNLKQSDLGDFSVSSHEVQSSSEWEKAKLEKMGEIGDPCVGE